MSQELLPTVCRQTPMGNFHPQTHSLTTPPFQNPGSAPEKCWWCGRLSLAPCQRYNLLLNRLFNNRVNVSIHDTTGCQTGLTTGCIVYTNIQPVVKPLWQPDWQPVGCLFTRYSRLSHRLYKRFDNRLCRVNGVLLRHWISRLTYGTTQPVTWLMTILPRHIGQLLTI